MSFSVLIVDDEKMPREILHRYIPGRATALPKYMKRRTEKVRWPWSEKNRRIS